MYDIKLDCLGRTEMRKDRQLNLLNPAAQLAMSYSQVCPFIRHLGQLFPVMYKIRAISS